MLFINSNVAPSVTVNIKTMDNSVNEEMIFCMSYGEKVNLYNAFMEENLEKWLQEKKVREIVEIAKDVYTVDKNATITFGFDSDLVQEQEKQRENISIFKEENMAEKKTKKYVAADDSTQTATRQQPRKEAKPVGNPGPLRFGAVVLWILALALEVCALMVFLGKLDLKFIAQIPQLIGFLVLDLIAVIVGAQLWKKANHIDPISEKNQLKFWLWNNMGLIAMAICFFPFIILVLTNKNADKKTKTIATVAAVICLLIGGVASYDWNPVSEEMKAAAMDVLEGETVYWTTFGKVYHTHDDCSHLNQSETLTYGTVEQAIAANRVRLCKTCAKRDNVSGVALED